MTDAADRSAAELRDAIARGEVSVRAAALDALGRADSVRAGAGGLNILLYQDTDLGDRCRTVQDAVDAGTGGPLAGVPVVIKDNIATTTLPTSCGSRILEGYISPYRATAVARLEQAGAVVVAKSNMDEFA
ncbi:MAG TPA: amidase family protein, partial [Gemmatimonadaceae bacterium]|nr:amidase family protein [Gemmatimonadaceae bacterium]